MNAAKLSGLLTGLVLSSLSACQSTSAGAGLPQMSGEEMMQRMMDLATPGEPHHDLAAMAGNWSAQTSFWMAPDAPPEVSSGTMKSEMIYDGRYLRGVYQGDMGGFPFEGVSLMGYDNARAEYFSTWYDSMSTGIAPTAFGMGDGEVFTLLAEDYVDPMSGQMMDMKQVLRIDGPNQHTFEMWAIYEGEEPFLSAEIVYTRM